MSYSKYSLSEIERDHHLRCIYCDHVRSAFHDGNLISNFSGDNCYHCMIINGRHENVIQYREGTLEFIGRLLFSH